MATKKTSKAEGTEISVFEVQRGVIEVCVVGMSPLICEAMSSKIQRGLLLPPEKKNAGEKASTLKHNPLIEYRDSVYRVMDDKSPTRIVFPSTAFKGAMRSVAIDIPGMAKAQIGRLTYVEGSYVPIFGVPKLLMSVVRNSDIGRTPDIRTRAIIEQWAARFTITYIKPILRDQIIVNLLAAAGMMRGIGGFRPEKGAGDYGQFKLVGIDDPEFQEIVAGGGREQQDLALQDPECFDGETMNLLSWFNAEVKRRGFTAAA